MVERDLDLFFAESGGAEESLGVFSGGCFENQCAIGRSFNLYCVVRTADGGDLLLGPEDVQLSERDGVIDGLDNKKRTERRQIRPIGRAVIVYAADGCVKVDSHLSGRPGPYGHSGPDTGQLAGTAKVEHPGPPGDFPVHPACGHCR